VESRGVGRKAKGAGSLLDRSAAGLKGLATKAIFKAWRHKLPGGFSKSDRRCDAKGVAMQDPTCIEEAHGEYEERFLEFIKLLAAIGKDEKLFPKDCRTCGTKYDSFPQYLCATTPKGHTLEDGSDVMHRPFTMVYRHCPCGNTLVLTLTQETFPVLDQMWAMLKHVAEERDQTLQEVVSRFVEECADYILFRDNPCLHRSLSEEQHDPR
jgi:hypothetical protein